MQGKNGQMYGNLSEVYAEIMRLRQFVGIESALDRCRYVRSFYPNDYQLVLFQAQYEYESNNIEGVRNLIPEMMRLRPNAPETFQFRNLSAVTAPNASGFNTDDTEDTTSVLSAIETPHTTPHYEAADRHQNSQGSANPFLLARTTVTSLEDYDDEDAGKTASLGAPDFKLSQAIETKFQGKESATFPLPVQEFTDALTTEPFEQKILNLSPLSTDMTVPMPAASPSMIRAEQIRWEQEQQSKLSARAEQRPLDHLEELKTSDFASVQSQQLKSPVSSLPPKAIATILDEDQRDLFRESVRSISPLRFSIILLLSTLVAYVLLFILILPQNWEKRVLSKLNAELENAENLSREGNTQSLFLSIQAFKRSERSIAKYQGFYALVRPFMRRDRIEERLIYSRDQANALNTILYLFFDPSIQLSTDSQLNLLPRSRIATAWGDFFQCTKRIDTEQSSPDYKNREECLSSLYDEVQSNNAALWPYFEYWMLMGYIQLERGKEDEARSSLLRLKKDFPANPYRDLLEASILERFQSPEAAISLLQNSKIPKSEWLTFYILKIKVNNDIHIEEGLMERAFENSSSRLKSKIKYWEASAELFSAEDSKVLTILDESLSSDPQNCEANSLKFMLRFFDPNVRVESLEFSHDDACLGSSSEFFLRALSSLAQGRKVDEKNLHDLALNDPLTSLFLSIYLALNLDYDNSLRVITQILSPTFKSPLKTPLEKVQEFFSQEPQELRKHESISSYIEAGSIWSSLMRDYQNSRFLPEQRTINLLLEKAPYCERAIRCLSTLSMRQNPSYQAIPNLCRDSNPELSARSRLCHLTALMLAHARVGDANSVIRLGEGAQLTTSLTLRLLLEAHFDLQNDDSHLRIAAVESILEEWKNLHFDLNELEFWQAKLVSLKRGIPVFSENFEPTLLKPHLQLKLLELQLSTSSPPERISKCEIFLSSSLNKEENFKDLNHLSLLELLRVECYAIVSDINKANQSALILLRQIRALSPSNPLQQKYLALVNKYNLKI